MNPDYRPSEPCDIDPSGAGPHTPRPAATDEALTIVREGLRPEREWLGETTPEAEGYVPRHAKEDAHIVPMLWAARSENA